MTTLEQRRALALRIAKTVGRDPASIVASLRSRLSANTSTEAFIFGKGGFDPHQPRDRKGRWTKSGAASKIEELAQRVKNMHSAAGANSEGAAAHQSLKDARALHARGKHDEAGNVAQRGVSHANSAAHIAEDTKVGGKRLGEAAHLPDNHEVPHSDESDVDEFMRLEEKLDNSYLTEAENARHDELRRKIEGPRRARERELNDIAENRGYITNEEADYLNQLTDSEFANEADESFLHGMTRDEWNSLSEAKKAVVYKRLETIDDEDLWRKFTDFEGS